MFALRLYEATAQRIATIHQANLDKNQPMKLDGDSLLLWGYDWVEIGRPGGMWLLVTQSRQDATRMLARKGLAERKAARADPVFALWLHQRTAQGIASSYGFGLDKDQSVAIGEHTALLWAFDWTDAARPGGAWLLLTQSRQEAVGLLAKGDAVGEAEASGFGVKITLNTDSLSSTIPVRFGAEAYTFCRVQNCREIWNVPEGKLCGVYLWCIEYQGDYLVNYVGKTTDRRGFEGRLWDELCYWRNGCNWKPVDLDAFKAGRRIPLSVVPPKQLSRELKELEPLYRIVLAPLSRASDCPRVENEIVYRLHANKATSQFLCNANPERYPHDPAVEIVLQDEPRVIGLTAPIPPSLR